jgi:hypothetical protein
MSSALRCGVHGLAGGHHDEDAAGDFERIGQVRQRTHGGHTMPGPLGRGGPVLLGFGIEPRHGKAPARHVQAKILAHDSQTDNADVIARHMRISEWSEWMP